MKLIALSFIATMIGHISNSMASDPFDQHFFVPIAYAGSGCPQGSVTLFASERDSSALRVVFDDFVVMAGGGTGKTIERKNCTLAFPIPVPEGYSVAIGSTVIRGENDLPHNSSATMNVSSFFAGEAAVSHSKRFLGPQDKNFNLTVAATDGVVWSKCGSDVTLRMNISVYIRNNNAREEAIAQISEIPKLFRLQWQKCR